MEDLTIYNATYLIQYILDICYEALPSANNKLFVLETKMHQTEEIYFLAPAMLKRGFNKAGLD